MCAERYIETKFLATLHLTQWHDLGWEHTFRDVKYEKHCARAPVLLVNPIYKSLCLIFSIVLYNYRH